MNDKTDHVEEVTTGFKKIGKEMKRPWVMLVLAGIVLIGLYNVFTG
tara:strand:+ start:53 stop:190 length:138 start_codon:yes stop_codon:yes gene_type:complete